MTCPFSPNPDWTSSPLNLAQEDQVLFADTLTTPPDPNAALQRAFDNRERLLGLPRSGPD
jgi:hypothetical protein